MAARAYSPFDPAPDAHRLSSTTALVIAASLGAHALLAAYLAVTHFAPPAPRDVEEIIPNVELVPLPKPDEPPPPAPEKPRIPVHAPPQDALLTPTVPPLPLDPPLKEVPAPIGPIATLDPPALPSLARDPVIHDPTWLKLPGPREFARYYPDREMRLGIEGKATLTCGVTANGSVTGCRVASLTPDPSGFGDAALKLSKYFRMQPQTVDGQPVEGGRVLIPVVFRLR